MGAPLAALRGVRMTRDHPMSRGWRLLLAGMATLALLVLVGGPQELLSRDGTEAVAVESPVDNELVAAQMGSRHLRRPESLESKKAAVKAKKHAKQDSAHIKEVFAKKNAKAKKARAAERAKKEKTKKTFIKEQHVKRGLREIKHKKHKAGRERKHKKRIAKRKKGKIKAQYKLAAEKKVKMEKQVKNNKERAAKRGRESIAKRLKLKESWNKSKERDFPHREMAAKK